MALNSELSELFRTMAALMDIKGENTFKAIAFSKVSRILKDMTLDLREAVASGKIKDIEGIGPSSQRIIVQYVTEGKSSDYEEVAASVPAGLIPMLEIPGLGPKTIAMLWKERKITSLEQLVAAIDAGKLNDLKGMGEKKIEGIKQGISLRQQAGKRIGIVDALPVGQQLLEQLRKLPEVAEAELAGSLRRRRETIGDVDLVCAVKNEAAAKKVADAFAALPQVKRVLAQGVTKVSILTDTNIQVDLRIVKVANFGAALLYFTGSKDHNTKIRGLALDKGMTLNEWGLYKLDKYEKSEKKTGQAPSITPVAAASEQDIYKALGMIWMEPEIREDRGEVEASIAGKLPKLVELKDIHGDLHCHTNASDGRASIEEMANAAKERGYEFLAITDHSKTQVIAKGLPVERLLKHIKEIHKVSDRIKGITLLAGCEVDILADGRMDYEDAILKELDIVVASPHLALKQDTDKATDRILRAIDNRYVNIVGHPTGRLIFSREGLPLNFEKVFKAAADSGTALEINGAYPRLDLNDVQAHGAIAAGAMLAVDTDAHSTEGLDAMPYGLTVARRAWATRKDIINCFTLAQLRSFIKQKRG